MREKITKLSEVHLFSSLYCKPCKCRSGAEMKERDKQTNLRSSTRLIIDCGLIKVKAMKQEKGTPRQKLANREHLFL